MNYERTVVDLFHESVVKYPHRIALNFIGKEFTWLELNTLSQEFSMFLLRKGVRHGDRVSLLLPNCPQFIIAYLGILKIGAVVAAMNPKVSTEEIRAMVKQAEPKLLITAENFSEHNRALCEDLNEVAPVMIVKLGDCMPFPINILYQLKNHSQKFYAPKGALLWKEEMTLPWNWTKKLQNRKWELVQLASQLCDQSLQDVSPNDLAVFQFTGGTTGIPKAAMLTHRNLVSNTLQAIELVNREETYVDENTIMLGVIPFFHVYGLSVCLNVAFALGTKVIVLPQFDSKMVFGAIAKHKANMFPGIPRMYAKLVTDASKDLAKHQKLCRSLTLVISGAGALDGEIKMKMEELGGAPIVEGYGLSEASPIVSINPVKNGKSGSMGKLVSDTEMKIVEGELWVRGPQVMAGYWQNEKETSEMIKEDGWLATGDMAHADKDGFLWFDDRKKDMIKVRGENVFTKEIEELLTTHPVIADVAVLGMPDKMLGERIVACVVLKEGQTLDQPSLEAFCREKKLASVKIPQEVAIVKEIPRTIIGKTLKRELRKMLAEKK